MCGIAGIIHSGELYETPEKIKKMVGSLSHRGPDGSGHILYKKCALGHARLSIVDVSGGAQPMRSSATEKVAITFNGEIYGYKEIKSAVAGYNFKNESDTELIISLYHMLGTKLVKKLPGIFSFAIWDDSNETLFCARDRFGEKPFYYAIGKNGEFIFSSEIKAITASGLVRPKLSKRAVMNYLRCLYVKPDETIYENIFTLPPAHCLVFKNGCIAIERYWKMPVSNYKINFNDACAEFERLIENSVRKQLVADVPVGAFLSGGLDSSTIVAIASKYKPDIKTISFGFGDSSELPYARAVAERYRTDHVEIVEKDYDIASLIVEMQKIYDEPFADSSNIPTYLISKAAVKHLKVVLSGDGGDEMMAGYSFWYFPLMKLEKAFKENVVKRYMFLAAAKLMSKLNISPGLFSGERLNLYRMCRRYKNLSAAHAAQNSYFDENDLSRLFPDREKLSESKILPRAAYSTLDEAIREDIADYMPGDILVKTDRASMACGLELRSPFLDVEFASFCISLPSNLKIDGMKDKLIMRSCFEKKWPAEVASRPKQGFGAPVEKWLDLKGVLELKNKYIFNKSNLIFSLLPYDEIIKIFKNNDYRSWALLNLSLWLETRNFSFDI